MFLNDFYKKTVSDIEKIQRKLDHVLLYNIRNYIVKLLIKTGIGVDYALPFIIGALLTINSKHFVLNKPFVAEGNNIETRVEVIDTSRGCHIEHVYPYTFSGQNIVLYSTGWSVNVNGLYERVEVSYKLKEGVDLEDTLKLKTYKKLDQILEISKTEKICKSVLASEDFIYESDSIIIVNYVDRIFRENESGYDNFLNSLWYIISSFFLGVNINNVGRFLFVERMRDKLREYEQFFKFLDENELDRLIKTLEVKKENLALLEDEDNSYTLRRERKD